MLAYSLKGQTSRDTSTVSVFCVHSPNSLQGLTTCSVCLVLASSVVDLIIMKFTDITSRWIRVSSKVLNNGIGTRNGNG